MRTILVTGTDRGLGFSLARQSLECGDTVFAACLDPEGEGPQSLYTNYPDRVTLLPLDLENVDSIVRVGEVIRSTGLSIDWLVNNAGILGDIEHAIDDPGLDFDDILRVMRINAVGTLRVIHELWSSVASSKERLIVNISSEAGSVGQNWRDRWFGYCMSKSALNMAGALVHTQLRELGGRVMQVHPGYVKSYMHGSKNEQATYESDEAASLILATVKRVLEREIAERPEFIDLNGNKLSW
ncbi:SDR family NAD(P)-dependent oxidoreductase [Pelagicoccus sp. SDUM812003]|uniref:SDR family NAD(P)-dependent oxidoreductase n=1 Tax=Pelagicoccus sp. SDUM812003 TaxID=3041267 RepID=UPI00280EF4A4|nr:SDR family NAD(P)-dependent oxidoreductase [Pelagicoccus sp. SDUM812003]MDQ8202237.1 SDR family NAD(P)-dependent oxidoreductase [Pelagicoccus sp. SDUM812003]